MHDNRHLRREEILAVRDGELDSRWVYKGWIETHLAWCCVCRARLGEALTLAAMLRSGPPSQEHHPSAQLLDAFTEDRIDRVDIPSQGVALWVERHLAACSSCAGVYEGLRADLDSGFAEQANLPEPAREDLVRAVLRSFIDRPARRGAGEAEEKWPGL